MAKTRPGTLVLTALASAAALSLSAGCTQRDSDSAAPVAEGIPDLAQTRAIAEEAYIYGLPMVLYYQHMYANFIDKSTSQYRGPFNELVTGAPGVAGKDPQPVSASSDTTYAAIQMDLRLQPLVICVPTVDEGRYYSIKLIDMYTFTYAYIGSRTTGNDEGCYMIAGPEWSGEKPDEIQKIYRSETQFSYAVFRTEVKGPGDIANVQRIQDGYKVQTLTEFSKRASPRGAPPVKFPRFGPEALSVDFPDFLDFALQFCPELPQEKALRARLARIGIGPGKKNPFKDLDQKHKDEVNLGIEEAQKKIRKLKSETGTQIGNWSYFGIFGDRASFKGDYLQRAAAAGGSGDIPAESVSLIAASDTAGETLDPKQRSYTLTFAPDQLPPVDGFWSLTAYDRQTKQPAPNALGRYFIASSMLPSFQKNADGSITLYLQKDAPAADKKANWLPVPSGPTVVAMRLYWPRDKPPSILPPGSGAWKPPGIEAARR